MRRSGRNQESRERQSQEDKVPLDALREAIGAKADLFLTGNSLALQDELKRAQSKILLEVRDSLIVSTPVPGRSPAFCLQHLPHVSPCNAASIKEWAELLFELAPESPWALHLFPFVEGKGERRLALVRESLVEMMKKRKRGALRALRPEGKLLPGDLLIQLLLLEPNEGVLSQTTILDDTNLSPFPGGRAPVAEDKRPPARAYRKLVEALVQFQREIRPNETVIDLGASPGSWTYIAVDRGAQVTAVDRSPLREDLMTRVDFQRADAFQFAPPKPVDWLLCDVIAFPDRIIELLKTWCKKRWCRSFCVTLKFRGAEDYQKIDEVKLLLPELCSRSLLRQLRSNRNEVTVVGEVT